MLIYIYIDDERSVAISHNVYIYMLFVQSGIQRSRSSRKISSVLFEAAGMCFVYGKKLGRKKCTRVNKSPIELTRVKTINKGRKDCGHKFWMSTYFVVNYRIVGMVLFWECGRHKRCGGGSLAVLGRRLTMPFLHRHTYCCLSLSLSLSL